MGRTGADAFTRRQTQGVKEARVEPMRLQRFLKKRLHPGGGTGFFFKNGVLLALFFEYKALHVGQVGVRFDAVLCMLLGMCVLLRM